MSANTHTHTDFHPRLPTLHTAQSTLLGFLKTRKVPRNIIPILPLRPPGYTAATRRAACFPALQRDEGLRFFRLPLGLSLLLIYHFSFSPERLRSWFSKRPFPRGAFLSDNWFCVGLFSEDPCASCPAPSPWSWKSNAISWLDSCVSCSLLLE